VIHAKAQKAQRVVIEQALGLFGEQVIEGDL